MGTVCPSPTLISFSTPAEGDGISASTLSVEISNSGSSRSTLSPGFLSHLVIVPSKMLSPIWGITISTAIFHLLVEPYEFLFAVSSARRRDALQLLKQIASVEKTHSADCGDCARVFQLRALKEPTGSFSVYDIAIELFFACLNTGPNPSRR